MRRSVAVPCLSLAFALACLPALADGPGKRDIKKAFKSGDRAAVKQVLEEVKGQLDKALVKAILDDARRIKSLGVYDELVGALASAQGEALDELLKQVEKEKKGDLRFLMLDALGGIPDPRAEERLVEALREDKDEPVRVLAARLLGRRGTASAVDALIPLLAELEDDGHERLVREVNGALQTLTGEDMSVAEDWKNYWTAHRDSYTKPEGEGDTKTRGNVLDRMAKQRPADLKTITRLRDDEVVVIKGNDRCEDALRVLDIKFTLIDRKDFDKHPIDPDKQVLFFNCPGKAELTEQGIVKLREFVAKGGYVFCSDWELGKTLTKAFPDQIQFLKRSSNREPKEVTIEPYPQTINHPLMRDVFPLNSWTEQKFAWKLHQTSDLAKPNPALVPLVRCPEIAEEGTDTVAFVLSFDRSGRPVTGRGGKDARRAGKVLFVSSHFKDQKDESGDGYALQQLLLNFIVEKQDQRKAAAQGAK